MLSISSIKQEVISEPECDEIVCTPSSPVFADPLIRPKRRGRPSKNSGLMCALCDFQADSHLYLELHTKTHLDKQAFPCPYCRILFSQKGNLQAHIRTHTKERPFKCKYCNFAATQKGNLNVHMRKHTKEKPYRCHQCDFTAAQVANLRSHLIRKHSGHTIEKEQWIDTKMYRCGQCLFVCSLKSDMVQHCKLLHPEFYQPEVTSSS